MGTGGGRACTIKYAAAARSDSRGAAEAVCDDPLMDARVAWLSIAPVKALGLVHPSHVELGPWGVSADRRFLLVDAEDRLVNGKRHGGLVRIEPDYDEAGERLTLRFPDGGAVSGDAVGGAPETAMLYGQPLAVRSVDGPLAESLTAYCGEPVRLLRVEPPATAVDRSRGGAVSILSVASLDALAEQAGVDAVDPRRFRMLIGVEGVGQHAEDGWLGRRVRVGDAVVIPAEPVGRCAVTTQDPDTGIPDLDTLRVIGSYRAAVPTTEPVPFGVWGAVDVPGRVAVGDAVALVD